MCATLRFGEDLFAAEAAADASARELTAWGLGHITHGSASHHSTTLSGVTTLKISSLSEVLKLKLKRGECSARVRASLGPPRGLSAVGIIISLKKRGTKV